MRYKNIKSIYGKILTVASLLITFGCTDLNVDIESQYTKIPDTERAGEAATADIFFAMRAPIGDYYKNVQTLSSDEAIAVSLNNDYYDRGEYVDFSLHCWTPDNPALNFWNPVMGGITKCNTVLEGLEPESQTALSVRAVRAYYFWALMDNFGAVPLVTGLLEKGSVVERSSRSEVAKFIESELLAVMEKLPTELSSATYGKPTQYMAQALLAKLYLNWAVYMADDVTSYTPSATNPKLNDVVKMCDLIIKSGKFDLSDKFRVKFYPDNGPHIKDFIYVMPFDRETQRGMTYARYWSHRSANKVFYGVSLPKSVGGNFRLNPSFYDLFNLEGDERNDQFLTGPLYVRDPNTYLATNEPWIVNGTHVTLSREIKLIKEDLTLDTGNDLAGRSYGYRSIKFYMDLKTTGDQNRSQSNDVPIFRYADVLLMKAEAILRGATPTEGATAQSLINEIRSYVNAPALTTTPTLQDLLDERGRELADESWRRNDLIRFGKFEEDWGFKHLAISKGSMEKYRRIFPLPTGVMNANTNWQQNPGY